MNSNATSVFSSASSTGSPPSAIHGRANVPAPKTSLPGQQKVCQ
jgi:hypothetical protein